MPSDPSSSPQDVFFVVRRRDLSVSALDLGQEVVVARVDACVAGGSVEACNDHRIAMAAAVASCGCTDPVTITGAEAVRKSYPNFFEDIQKLRIGLDFNEA